MAEVAEKFKEMPGWLKGFGREDNGYHDSYFYESFWNGEKVEEKMVGATAFAPPNPPLKFIECSPEERAAASAWMALEGKKARRALLPLRPAKGMRVRIINNGRKGKKGEEGEVFWSGMKSFDRYGRWPSLRVGVELDSGEKVFKEAHAVEVIYVPLSMI